MSGSRQAIPFNRPHVTGREFGYIQQAIAAGHLSGKGPFTARCDDWLTQRTGARRALLTHSGSGALEMCALLSAVGPGDEVIMPSFTFVTTASAFVLRGAVPVFVDIRPDTLNLDTSQIEAAITPRTKAVVAVHYAGVSCDMDEICAIARRYDLLVIEDAAQGILSSYRGLPLGGIGSLGALSFHETKNITSGEGGALLVGDDRFVERAEIVLEKGTNRRQFARGEVDKYSWVDLGSSFVPSEISAAFLWAQMEEAETVTARRLEIWDAYNAAFAELEASGRARRPIVPADRQHNGHLFYLLTADPASRSALIAHLRRRDIHAVFHYVPLHSAPAGRRYGRAVGTLAVTDELSARIVRLPLWCDLTASQIERVIDAVYGAFAEMSSA